MIVKAEGGKDKGERTREEAMLITLALWSSKKPSFDPFE
jgi:hypothetical protein